MLRLGSHRTLRSWHQPCGIMGRINHGACMALLTYMTLSIRRLLHFVVSPSNTLLCIPRIAVYLFPAKTAFCFSSLRGRVLSYLSEHRGVRLEGAGEKAVEHPV